MTPWRLFPAKTSQTNKTCFPITSHCDDVTVAGNKKQLVLYSSLAWNAGVKLHIRQLKTLFLCLEVYAFVFMVVVKNVLVNYADTV